MVYNKNVMKRLPCFIVAAIIAFLIAPVNAQDEDEEDVRDSKIPPGMVQQKLGNKPSVTAILPEGTAVRREGDLRVLEGSGEYAARKFVKYDALFAKMNDDIASLKKEIDDMKETISKMQQKKLVSQ